MEDKQPLDRRERGAAEPYGYNVSLEVEVWWADSPRPATPELYTATQVSLQELRLVSLKPVDVGYRFSFVVLFPKRSTGENVALINGIARIFRRTQVSALGAECYVLEARIERILSMWEGEEKPSPTHKKPS